MTKKIIPLSSYLSAKDAASLLSKKLDRTIDPEYLTKLAKSKKQPVRTRSLGYHQLYCKEDLERVTVRKKKSTLE